MSKFGVIVHGGAWNIPDEAVDGHVIGIKKATDLAYQLLSEGEDAIDVVEKVMILLEDDEVFDAGTGSFANRIGEIELDALIASDDYKIGAVAAVQNIKNPIKLARVVRDKTDNILIVGKGANILAQEYGIEECKMNDLLLGREAERFEKIKQDESHDSRDAFRSQGSDTVGCVCVDKKGKIAVALSTGGIPFKRPGRVGDVVSWGSGAYCEKNVGGVAATGHGEYIIRVLASRQVLDFMKAGLSPMDASKKTVKMIEELGGSGGVIALGFNHHGDPVFGFAYNTPRMAFAYRTEGGELNYGFENNELSNPVEQLSNHVGSQW